MSKKIQRKQVKRKRPPYGRTKTGKLLDVVLDLYEDLIQERVDEELRLSDTEFKALKKSLRYYLKPIIRPVDKSTTRNKKPSK